MIKSNGMMFILSSPSGAGKTTLTKKLKENNKNFQISISHTTRKPRPNEVDGKEYNFVNTEQFQLLIKEGSFFEYATIFGNYYGTLKKPVLDALSHGKDVLFDIDWQGTEQLKKIPNLNLITFFILPPDVEILKTRLLNRDQNKKKSVEERMKKFNEEVSHWKDYDYVIINDDLERCYGEVLSIIQLEKKGKKKIQKKDEIKDKVKQLIK